MFTIEGVNNEVVAMDETILDQLKGEGKQNDLGLSTEVFHNLNFSFFKNILSAFCIKKKVPKVCKVCLTFKL